MKRIANTDRFRRYNSIYGTHDPFTPTELKEFVTRPLTSCVDMEEFSELAEWCSENKQLFETLTAAVKRPEQIAYLEANYGS